MSQVFNLLFSDYCAEKKCEQLCISEENGATCICADGYKLNSTGNCEGYNLAYMHNYLIIISTVMCICSIKMV